MKPIIVAYNRVSKAVLDDLQHDYEVYFFKDNGTKQDPAFLNILEQAVGVIGLELTLDEHLLDHAPNLKIVSNVSVGYDNLEIKSLTRRGIMATNTPGVLDDTVADAVFGLLIATARRIPELDRFVKTGQWTYYLDETHFGADVHHKIMGIIGMGRIGQAIAKRASLGFDMKILYYNRSRKPEAEEKYNATYCDLTTLLKESDFVCQMLPLNPDTEGFIGSKEFKLMKKSAIFINGSRGKTVVEEDLIRSLQVGEIRAAGLDVFEQEPVSPDNPLLKMENVVTLPHIGSSTGETELAMSQLAAKNLRIGLAGKKPPNLLNPEILKRK